MNPATYIHYGSRNYNADSFQPVTNINCIKPSGGLWVSNVNSKVPWSEWCARNNYRVNSLSADNCFYIKIKNTARILQIKSIADLRPLPKLTVNSLLKKLFPLVVYLDFEELSNDYDAIEVTISESSELYWALYGWDCDCTLIMNKDVIIYE